MMDYAGMDRRTLLQRALLLAGVAVLPGGAQALAAAAKGGKRQLDPARYALLVALADTFIPKTATPGAVEAGVPEVVDALLGAWASPKRKAELVGAMDKIDQIAQQKNPRGFAAMTPAERAAVLAPHDAAALKPPPPSPSQSAIAVGAAPTTVDPNYGKAKQEPAQGLASMGPQFTDPAYGKLKELIVVVFYCSETALTHDLAYEHSPGEWQASTPITAATRPWGGLGSI